jgi:hypothetical protein
MRKGSRVGGGGSRGGRVRDVVVGARVLTLTIFA